MTVGIFWSNQAYLTMERNNGSRSTIRFYKLQRLTRQGRSSFLPRFFPLGYLKRKKRGKEKAFILG
jgi:hypothetical protein